MAYPKRYLHVGSAADLEGRDRITYRALEMVPGILAWGTLFLMVVLSWKRPVWVAIFIIAFDLYWLVKTIFLAFHIRANWRRMQHHLQIDWKERLETVKWSHLWQLVVLPTAGEPEEVIAESIDSLAKSDWPKERMIVVLGMEDKGEDTRPFQAGIQIEEDLKTKHTCRSHSCSWLR